MSIYDCKTKKSNFYSKKVFLTYEIHYYYGLCHEMILFGLVIFVRILRHTTRRFLCKISEIISDRLMSA